MSGFSIDWLDLREPADARARNPDLLARAAALTETTLDPLIVDLGCGSGSQMRALGPRLKSPVAWRLVDGDPDLLAEAARRAAEAGHADVEAMRLDLSGNVLFPFQNATLVTASALFDLVSDAFVARLVATLASRRSALYATLSYDGTTRWTEPHALDEAVLEAFNRDQRRDKGFGPALGPTSIAVLSETLHRAGYKVTAGDSPWLLGPEDAALTRAFAIGIAEAVSGAAGVDADAVSDWLAFRLEQAETGTVHVGHVDLLAEPG